MKKNVFALLFLLSGVFIYAQELHYGVKAGLNVANITGDLDDNDPRVSLHAGVVLEIGLNDKFSIQPEVLYSSQGTKFEEKESYYGEYYEYEEKIKLDYLNIPIMAKYYIVDGLSVEAGPQIGFLLSAKSDWEEKGSSFSDSGKDNIKDALKKVDFGLNFGAGYKFDFGLALNARYNLGLTKVNDGGYGKIRNGVFQFSVGYFFN